MLIGKRLRRIHSGLILFLAWQTTSWTNLTKPNSKTFDKAKAKCNQSYVVWSLSFIRFSKNLREPGREVFNSLGSSQQHLVLIMCSFLMPWMIFWRSSVPKQKNLSPFYSRIRYTARKGPFNYLLMTSNWHHIFFWGCGGHTPTTDQNAKKSEFSRSRPREKSIQLWKKSSYSESQTKTFQNCQKIQSAIDTTLKVIVYL